MIKKDKHLVLQERIRHELPYRYGITPTNELAKEWGVSVDTLTRYAKGLKLSKLSYYSYRGEVLIRKVSTGTIFASKRFKGKNERKAVMDELYERYRVGIATGYYAISVII